MLFCFLISSISFWFSLILRRRVCMHSVVFFSIWARLAWSGMRQISHCISIYGAAMRHVHAHVPFLLSLLAVIHLLTFSPLRVGTASRKLVKLSFMWSLLRRSSALWCARFSALKQYKNKQNFQPCFSVLLNKAITTTAQQQKRASVYKQRRRYALSV